jgi:hypothetical protein
MSLYILHYGNILIDFDEPKINEYKISNHLFTVDTSGCEPIFIDFGRASRSSRSSSSAQSSNDESTYINSSIINWTLQEVLILLKVLQRNVKNEYQVSWLEKVYKKVSKYKSDQNKECVEYIHAMKIKKS